jgi:uncharacterized protein
MSPSHEWPVDLLDVSGMVTNGFRPFPFREFVLKVHQRCNLACDYCYVYTMADQTWRTRPATMSTDVWRATAHRIAEHARKHALAEVRVILHGGEPLLAGRERLVALIADMRAELSTACQVRIAVQTNALMLEEPMLDALLANSVEIGVSLDGTPEGNDRHRRRPDGRGTHAAVDRALARLGSPPYRSAFAGLLCTIDPESDPIASYHALSRIVTPRAANDRLLTPARQLVPAAPPAAGDRARPVRRLARRHLRSVVRRLPTGDPRADP